tara:strand:- start:3631 stop:3894 length:264 start_codon:yes stop_codon:yes gene_type:complete
MKNRRKKVFERVVNPILLKYLTNPHSSEVSIAKGIPMKYLKYFKEVSANKNAKKIRYRYRGKSKINYNRDQSYCLMNFADTFAVYYR